VELTQAALPILRRGSVAHRVKRLLDIVGSVVGLTLFSPIFLLVGFLVKIEDGGPVIYRRRVIGPDGEFDAYKFRSMCANADERLQADPWMLAAFCEKRAWTSFRNCSTCLPGR
jgi:lipopolysaccharide/colanic/teichoic acid biosynthesis glycosyltransferase